MATQTAVTKPFPFPIGTLLSEYRLKLISITPEPGTVISYDELAKGVPITAVIESTAGSAYVHDVRGTLILMGVVEEISTPMNNPGVISRSLNGVSTQEADTAQSRVTIQGILTLGAVYQGKITVVLMMGLFAPEYNEFSFLQGVSSKDKGEVQLMVEYPVAGTPIAIATRTLGLPLGGYPPPSLIAMPSESPNPYP